MADITLNKLSRRYPSGVHAVRELELTCPGGKITCIVGPSGSGKTTTLRLIAGLEKPDSGTISVGGKVINDLPPHRRDLALVFQDASLYPHMTVRENMTFTARQLGIEGSPLRHRVEETAAMLGLTILMDRTAAELSGGERQRAALGKAIVRRPRILLLDEPLSQLDPAQRLLLRSEIRALQAKLGLTIVHVTHDQEEALSLGDQVALIKDGSLVQCGPPREIFQRPASRFAAEFLGSPPMNILLGRVDQHDGRLWFSDGRDVAVAIAPHQAGRMMRHLGTNVILGIRPSAIQVKPTTGTETGLLRGQVQTVEYMGDRAVVHVAMGSGFVVRAAVSSERAGQAGEQVQLELDANSLCFFEPGAGYRSIL